MGGFFGVASETSCTNDLFFGIDYHSHLGTRRGGMAVYGKDGFHRSIHNIENSPFRTKFDPELDELEGTMGIGCISDMDPQPLLVRSHHGSYALTTVGRINNAEELVKRAYERGNTHFMEMSGSRINETELVGVILDQAGNIVDGLKHVQDVVDGSLTMLLLTSDGIYAMRDKYGRTPCIIGKKEGAYCATFETSAYINLGYEFAERTIDRTELYTCDEAFLCGSAMEVTPVLSIDKYEINGGVAGEVTKNIHKTYVKAASGELEEYKEWVTAIY